MRLTIKFIATLLLCHFVCGSCTKSYDLDDLQCAEIQPDTKASSFEKYSVSIDQALQNHQTNRICA